MVGPKFSRFLSQQPRSRPARDEIRLIWAKFDGHCVSCPVPVQAGERVQYRAGVGVAHLSCPMEVR